MKKPDKNKDDIQCSFCGESKQDAGAIITTYSGAAICAECLSRFKEKMDGDKKRDDLPHTNKPR